MADETPTGPSNLSPEAVAQFQEMWTAIKGLQSIQGGGFNNSPFGLSFTPTPGRRGRRIGSGGVESVPFVVRITAATQDGSNKRWKYEATEVDKTTAGYGGWTDLSGGRTATGATNGIYLYNLIEDQNGATGTYGNGVASTNLTGTFALQKIPTGTRVAVLLVKTISTTTGSQTTTTEEWFTSYVNGIDGECPA